MRSGGFGNPNVITVNSPHLLFKIAGKTHHQCNHPKHKEGFENGSLSPWDTLQEFYNTCQSHEFKKP